MTFSRADVDSTIPARFEAVVREAGERLALSGNGRHWTYRDLNAHANRIAHAIASRAPGGAGCVGYVIDQSPEMVVATLGVLKAGKAYLAVHPGTPRAAQAEIVRDAAPDLVLATEATRVLATDAVAGACPVITLEEIDDEMEEGAGSGSADNPDPIAQPDDPASVFFTSGTTGRPKGVVRSHRTVLHRVWLSSLHEGITAYDRQSLLTHTSFGASQADLAGALLLGATLCVFDVVPEGLTSFADWIDAEGITLLRPPVQLFRRFLAGLDGDRRFPLVRLVTLGGDTVLVADVEAWRRHSSPTCAVLHRFSTTETSLLTSSRFEFDTVLDPATLSAGHPVEDIELTLVDADGRSVAAGEEGEVVASSAYLADGYWRAPDETARVFTTDPERPGWRRYRSGDLGRFLPDGRLALLGRQDHQVKIRGYRVEAGEVEAAIRRLDDVADAAVVVIKEEGEQQLLAFVVMREGGRFDAGSIRQRLTATLPEWKVPARIHALELLPTTANGKLDRRRLREIADLEPIVRQREAPPVVEPPIDDIERQIATVFQRVLRCGALDRSADFFLLGGDSLQATVLHQQVERLIGRRFPLETLVRNATIRGIADVVRLAQQSAPPDPADRPPVLVPLRATGSQAALFLVHGRLGQAFVSPHFLEIFGADQPVYAFQVPGLDPARIPNNTIAEMAAEYVRAMRRVQPVGPYLLGAACAGAMIAVEMANVLEKMGERVGPLLLIDPPVTPPGDLPWWPRSVALARAYAKRCLPRAVLARRLVRSQRRYAEIGRVGMQFEDRSSLDQTVQAVLTFEIARLKHRRWAYDGPVLMLRSASRLQEDGPTKRGAFGRHLTGDVQWFNVGTHHYSVRQAGNQAMADGLRRALDIARTAMAALRHETSSRA